MRAARASDKNGNAWEGKGQVIKLPVKCEGTPQIKWSDIPSRETIDANRQYHRILIIILKVAKVKIEKKKRATGTVCEEVPDDSDHDDDPLL